MRHPGRNQRFAGGFVNFSWWASAVAGGIVFIVMYWVAPALLAHDPLWSDLGRTSRTFAWLPLLVFASLALIALARSMILGQSGGSGRDRRKSHRSWRDTSVNISRLRLKHGWGVTMQRAMPATRPKAVVHDKWSLEALRALEWKRFELLCAEYYKIAGFHPQTIHRGADGAIEMKLFKGDPAKPLAVLQCKTGMAYTVGVKEVRELVSAMSREKTERGTFITTGAFNRDALNFADDHPIQLLDGESFLRKIQALSRQDQDRLLRDAFKGDYNTPTCPSCSVKMIRRARDGKPLWACVNSAKCGNTFAING